MSMIAMSPAELLMMMMLWIPSQPQGQPADANTVFRYVPHQASLTVGLDAGSLTTSAMQGFQDLGQQPLWGVYQIPPDRVLLRIVCRRQGPPSH